MYLKNIKIHNFFTLHDVDIKLGPHPFIVTGQNNDETSAISNGSGKSMLCQSIMWCLFDTILRKQVKKDDVIGVNGDHTMVEINLEHDGKDITITRYRGHSEHKHNVVIMVDGNDESQHKDSEEYIEQLLGISKTIIQHCAYTDKRSQSIVELSPAALKKVVAEIIDTQRFDDYLSDIRKEMTEVKNKHQRFVDMMRLKENEIEKAEFAIKVESGFQANFEQDKKETLAKNKLEMMDYEKRIKELDEKLVGFDHLEKTYEDLLEKTQGMDELNQRYNSLKKLRSKKDEELKKVSLRLEKLTAKATEVDNNYANLFNNPEGVCSYCGNHIADSKRIDEIGDRLKKEKDDIELKRIDVRTKFGIVNKELIKFDMQIEELSGQLQGFSEMMTQLNKVASAINTINKIKGNRDSLVSKLDALKVKDKRDRKAEPDKKLLNHLIEQKDDIEKDLLKFKKEAEECTQTANDLELLKDLVSYIKVSTFNNFVYTLLDMIEENLDDMTDGDFQVQLKSNKDELEFLFTQESKHGKALPFSAFSSGEQIRISKAVSMALIEMLDIGFFIDDEGLVNADDAGISSILDFIIKKNKGRTYFFVGHQKALLDYFEGNGNIHVEKTDGTSKVEMRTV